MMRHGLSRKFRTGGHIAAAGRQGGREPALIVAQKKFWQALHGHRLTSFLLRGLMRLASPPSPRCIAANPCSISFSNCAKSTWAADFFGLITISTGDSSSCRCLRIAARTRRLMRLRTTDPPNARPTVRPTLTPLAPSTAWPGALVGAGPRTKKKVRFPQNWRCPVRYTRSKSTCLSRRAFLGKDSRELFTGENPAKRAPLEDNERNRGTRGDSITL